MFRLIADGEVVASTPVRNALMGGYTRADHHQQLKAKLAEQPAPPPTSSGPDSGRDADGNYLPTGTRKLLAIRGRGSYASIRTYNFGICLKRIVGGVFDIAVLLLFLGLFMLLSFAVHWDDGEVKVWRQDTAYGHGGYFVSAPSTTPHGSVWHISDPYSKRTENSQRFELNRPYHTFSVANYSTGTVVDFRIYDVEKWLTTAAKWWVAWVAFYYFILVATAGRTLGMELVRLRVDGGSGAAPRPLVALVFTGAMFLCGWLYPITAIFTAGRGLHLLISRTDLTPR